MEYKQLLKSVIILILIANGISYLYDFVSIGKTYSYTYSCDSDKRAGFTIGKGWTCTKDYRSMANCFNQKKQEGEIPEDCHLLRTFEMKFYHVHRWLHYALDPMWHHSYKDLPNQSG